MGEERKMILCLYLHKIIEVIELRRALKKIANPPKNRNYTGYMKRIAAEALKDT